MYAAFKTKAFQNHGQQRHKGTALRKESHLEGQSLNQSIIKTVLQQCHGAQGKLWMIILNFQ